MDFLLVHGAYHGPWCWSLLEPELTARGHTVTLVDLPVSDPEAGAILYRDAVLDVAESLEMPVVVGHSMAGGIIPLVAEARPVRAMVFLCAFIPEPGRSLNDLRREQPIETFHPSVVEFEDLGLGSG